MPFQTKITRARVKVGPFTSEQMQQIGLTLLDSISSRIKRAENVDDSAAKALKPGRTVHGRQLPGYPDYKKRRGLQALRDWTWRGRTMRSLKVQTASENRVTIGFVDDQADRIAHTNNLRERQFGVSPKDKQAVIEAVRHVQQTGQVAHWDKVA